MLDPYSLYICIRCNKLSATPFKLNIFCSSDCQDKYTYAHPLPVREIIRTPKTGRLCPKCNRYRPTIDFKFITPRVQSDICYHCNKKVQIYKGHYSISAVRKNTETFIISKLRDISEGKCSICKDSRRLVLDHDHETGKYRGFLCDRCNLNLGTLLDSVALIDSIIEFLQSPSLLPKESRSKFTYSLDTIRQLLPLQDNSCASCQVRILYMEDASLSCDPKTRVIRAVVCSRCHMSMEKFNWDIHLFQMTKEYLINTPMQRLGEIKKVG